MEGSIMKEEIKLRPEVKLFAEQMELKLRENDHKGGWEKCELPYLQKRLNEEEEELNEAIYKRWTDWGRSVGEGYFFGTLDDNEIVSECADIANFAMMIATKFNLIPKP